MFTQHPSARKIRLRSDTHAHVRYDVTIEGGAPVRCSCPGWRRWRRCKHLERAALIPNFLRAHAALEAEGWREEGIEGLFRDEVIAAAGDVTAAIRSFCELADEAAADADVLEHGLAQAGRLGGAS